MSKAWPKVKLGAILAKSDNWIEIDPNRTYKQVTVKLWGRGVVLRNEIAGTEIASSRRLSVKSKQFIVSRIDARNGAFGLVPETLDCAVVTNDFPVFDLDVRLVLPEYLEWMSKTKDFVQLCIEASEGTTNRVRLKEERFLASEIPLPPLPEQRRIVARIRGLAAKIEEAWGLRQSIESDEHGLLLATHHKIAAKAPRQPMSEVAPLSRRPVSVDIENEYPQVAVRSFGKGTFHKSSLRGAEITWQKPYLVKAGDILISNIKAWEGAVAVATEEDDGRVGSHRYLTCVPVPGVATARFIFFHLLSPEGVYELEQASPGSADRNRTLNVKALMRIPIPVPPYEEQRYFDGLYQKVNSLRRHQTATAIELDAFLPSLLDKAFKGEL